MKPQHRALIGRMDRLTLALRILRGAATVERRTMKTATLVREISRATPYVTQKLWRLSEPIAGADDEDGEFTHIVTSASALALTGPETYIFGADAEGEILNWMELEGSFRGELDHERAVRGAGYVVLEGDEPTIPPCRRCTTDLTEAVTRWLDEGGPQQCPHCSLEFPLPADSWLRANGYSTGDDE